MSEKELPYNLNSKMLAVIQTLEEGSFEQTCSDLA
jgi:hypothetical protein